MRGMSGVRASVALLAAATILAGCGAQGGGGSAGTTGGAAAADTVVAGGGASQSAGPDAPPGTTNSGATGNDDRAVGKPPPGAYDDTSGTRTGNPRAQGAVLAHLPGPSRSTCVTVGARSVVRSGEVGMGSFSQARSVFAQAKTPYNAAPSFFYVIPRNRTAGAVTVVASRPGTGVAPVRVRSDDLESAAQWHYFPIHMQIPSRGTWRFQVSVDGDRGCFVASFT
jgi:hypothetical protein